MNRQINRLNSILKWEKEKTIEAIKKIEDNILMISLRYEIRDVKQKRSTNNKTYRVALHLKLYFLCGKIAK